jgi:PAS domain S-box-containing protein
MVAVLFSSYSAKITSLFLILGLFPVIGISYFLYSEEIGIVLHSLEISLLSQSENTSELISKWLMERENDVIDIASNKVLISKTNILVNPKTPNEIYYANFDLQTQSAIFLENNPWLLEYVISDQSGKILFSTGDRITKEHLMNQAHFKSALEGKLGISDIYQSQDIIKNENGFYELLIPTMWISYPIRGEVGINGVLSARIDVFQIPQVASKQTDYNSLDVYLVNSKGYFISKPKFSDLNDETKRRPELEVLVKEPDSRDFTQIFQLANQKGTKLNLIGYNNYVGESVIGSITHVENTNWYVIAEINKNESDSKIFSTQIILFDFISLSILTIIGASIYLSSKIIEPIRNLKQATEIVSTGNFDIKLKPKGNDEISFLFESFNSMTESLKNARNRISSTELKYKQLYDGAPDLYRTINPSGIILDCNIAYAKSLGYTKEEIIGKSIFEHVDKNSLDVLQDVFTKWKKTGNVKNREIWMKRKDDSIFPTMFSVTSIYDENGQLIGSNTVIRDMSEIYSVKKEIEEQKMKRLSVIGELTARIAHDLRNPLSVIKNTVSVMRLQNPNLDEKIITHLARLERATTRISHQVNEVLDFVNPTLLQLDNNLMSTVLNSTMDRIVIPDTVRITLPQNDVTVFCDAEKIEIVLANLITNAIQAMHNNGEVNIRITEEKKQIIIEVEDVGPGIPLDILPQIFDPLFTTRQIGTGLGLVSCKSIVEKHGGTIEVKTELGKGTTFVIMLPKN